MDATTETLTPATQLARENPLRVPGESAEYRAARNALLAEEIELRRHIERVAVQRRALPAGAPVTGDYRFMTEHGPSDLAGLFGDKQTLITFNFMFGPQRQRPCPMCTNMLDSWDANARDIEQQAALAIVARSPIERLLAWKQERGWRHLRLVSDLNDNFFRDYFGFEPDGSETGGHNVFTLRDGVLRHFWAAEITTADPGQDPRGAPDPAPLWNALDMTPEGRPADWYPRLSY